MSTWYSPSTVRAAEWVSQGAPAQSGARRSHAGTYNWKKEFGADCNPSLRAVGHVPEAQVPSPPRYPEEGLIQRPVLADICRNKPCTRKTKAKNTKEKGWGQARRPDSLWPYLGPSGTLPHTLHAQYKSHQCLLSSCHSTNLLCLSLLMPIHSPYQIPKVRRDKELWEGWPSHRRTYLLAGPFVLYNPDGCYWVMNNMYHPNNK